MEEIFALALEARCPIRHDTSALCCADLAAEIGLAGGAELAFAALWGTVVRGQCQFLQTNMVGFLRTVLECYHMVARLHGCCPFTDRFDNAGAFMPEDDRKGTFGVFARQCVGI